MNLTDDERDLMTRVVLGESSADPTERASVAWNVLNRVGKPGFADTIRGVVTQRNAYTSRQDPKGPYYVHSPKDYADARKVVDSVAAGETRDPTHGNVNFVAADMPADKRPQWAPKGKGQTIGKTEFYGGSAPMSKAEADQYLADRRSRKANTPDIMSKDEADQWLQQYRAQRAPSAPVAGDQPDSEKPQAEQPPQESFTSGVGLSTLFHDLPEPVQGFIREHPYASGAIAAGAVPLAIAALPEAAVGAGIGALGRYAVGPLVRGAAQATGLGTGGYILGDLVSGGKLHEQLPKVIDMISRLGEEGAH